MKVIFGIYVLLLLSLSIFSYGFVDANFPLKTPVFLSDLVNLHRPLSTMVFIVIVTLLFGFYGWILWAVKTRRINLKQIIFLLGITIFILFFSFPAFSYDIFNYMATAKVTFLYRENPYLVMPIEFSGEPMLEFMHAANKTALYGPVWILLTAIPHVAGLGNLILTVFTFKAFVLIFYLVGAYLIWKLSDKNINSLVLFAFNPLILIETLVSSHNDVVMMTFILLAFQFTFKKQRILGFTNWILSLGIKYATVVLLPVFLLQKKLSKEQIFHASYWLMFLVFLASPIREEIYSWYVIWLITFAVLIPKKRLVFYLTLALSLGTLLRYTPFLYTGTWEGITPLVKKIVTTVPLGLVSLAYFIDKLWLKKFFRS